MTPEREIERDANEAEAESETEKIKVFDQTFSEKFCLIYFLLLFCLAFVDADGGGDGGSFETVTSFSSRHGCVRIQCQNDNLYIEMTALESLVRHASRCNSLYLLLVRTK